jgi:DNA-binding CsgD family transcriptional regulator
VSDDDSTLVIAVELDDPALADRLTALLGEVKGLRLAAPGEAAALAVVSRSRSERDTLELTPRERDTLELTPRERDVLTLMAEGASNKQIAKQLGISVHTAKFHVASVLEKLDATGRTDAVAHAARIGVIHL